jgi:hypothetical protein
MRAVVFFPLLLLLAVATAGSQGRPSFLSATTGAACYEVAYADGYLYAGCGNTLMVFDARSSTPPLAKLFEQRFTSNIDHILVHDGRLFVAANHAGLSMWDITTPSAPRLLDEYLPEGLDEAAYYTAFFGDTIFVAYKSRMAIFRVDGERLRLVSRFADQPSGVKIRGCAVRDSLLAFTTAFGPAADNGVHLYNARTLEPISFHHQDYCSPEGVLFGQKTSLLHVLGGTASLNNPLDPNGLFYSLDISDPRAPVEVFRDTLNVVLIGLAIAQPMNAEIRNDTVFVATQAAIDIDYKPGDPFTGNVYVYDATEPSRERRLATIDAGLWHFDLALDGNTMYVASEWYGVKTVDITDIHTEVDRGNTLTGGWNLGSAVHGNRLAVGNEGYGLKLYDISDRRHPVLLRTDTSGGFCMNVEFSEDGRHIFGYYLTGDGFRVYDAATLEHVGSLPRSVGDKRTWIWRDRAVSLKLPSVGAKELFVVNIANPIAPVLDTSFTMNNVRDIAVDRSGKLFVATNDSLALFDLADRLHELASVRTTLFQDFTALAVHGDTLYAWLAGPGGGLVRYTYDAAGRLTEIGRGALPFPDPRFLAADSFGLYAAYVEQGLLALDKVTLARTGYYRHGMEFVHDFLWGPQDLFCVDGMLVLVEYFGQTTLLTNDPRAVAAAPAEPGLADRAGPRILYDRAPRSLRVEMERWGDGGCDLILYDARGERAGTWHLGSPASRADVGDLPPGVYVAVATTPTGIVRGKLLIAR